MPPTFSISYGRTADSSISGEGWWQALGDRNSIYLQKGAQVHLDCNIEGLDDTSLASSCVFTVTPHLPSGLVFDPRTGSITGEPTASSEQKQHNITCKVCRGGGDDDDDEKEGTKRSIPIFLTIREPTPEFSARLSKKELIQLQVGKHMSTIRLLVRRERERVCVRMYMYVCIYIAASWETYGHNQASGEESVCVCVYMCMYMCM